MLLRHITSHNNYNYSIRSNQISLTANSMSIRKHRRTQHHNTSKNLTRNHSRIGNHRRPQVNPPRINRMRIPKILTTRRHTNLNRTLLSRQIPRTHPGNRPAALNSSLHSQTKTSRIISGNQPQAPNRFAHHGRDNSHQQIRQLPSLISSRATVNVTIRNGTRINLLKPRNHLRVPRILQFSQIHFIIQRNTIRIRMRPSSNRQRHQRPHNHTRSH